MPKVIADADSLKDIVQYIGATKPILKKWAELEQTLSEAAPDVIDLLVDQGIFTEQVKEAKVKQFVSNPVEILNTLKKVASTVGETGLGTAVESPLKTENKNDADSAYIRRLVG